MNEKCKMLNLCSQFSLCIYFLFLYQNLEIWVKKYAYIKGLWYTFYCLYKNWFTLYYKVCKRILPHMFLISDYSFSLFINLIVKMGYHFYFQMHFSDYLIWATLLCLLCHFYLFDKLPFLIFCPFFY